MSEMAGRAPGKGEGRPWGKYSETDRSGSRFSRAWQLVRRKECHRKYNDISFYFPILCFSISFSPFLFTYQYY